MGGDDWTEHDLRVAATAFAGVHVHESRWSPVLAASADYNSKRCTELDRGGHHNWDRRFQELRKTNLGLVYGEINAESWKRQEDMNPVMLWTEAFRCWKQSKGHWGVASVPHKWYGGAIRKSKAGIWYMTIVVADGGEPLEPEDEPEDYKLW